MIAPTLRLPRLASLFSTRREATPTPAQPEHEAAMAHRQCLGEMLSRSPDAFSSDLDVVYLSCQHGGPF